MSNIEALCRASGIEILRTFKATANYKSDLFSACVDQCDIAIVNGEGTMHHDQTDALHLMNSAQAIKEKRKKCYLINTVWQDNIALSKRLDLFDGIFVRESFSQMEIRNAGHDAAIVPDLSLYSTNRSSTLQKPSLSMRTAVFDSVNWSITKILARYAAHTNAKFFLMDGTPRKRIKSIKLLQYLVPSWQVPKIATIRDVRESANIISGRFHATCMAIKYGIPFLAIPSNTHKIEGMLADIGLPSDTFVVKPPLTLEGLHNGEHASARKFESFLHKIHAYNDLAQRSTEGMFKDISAG